jgi:hypothetical protein
VLWLAALVFGAFGVHFLVNPLGWAGTVDVAASTPTARTEIRAMYGGLEIGLAVFLAWCALDPTRVRIGLMASLCLFAGVALARAASLIGDPGSRSVMYTILGTEIVAVAAAGVALRLHR